jgi:hypothetical protein
VRNRALVTALQALGGRHDPVMTIRYAALTLPASCIALLQGVYPWTRSRTWLDGAARSCALQRSERRKVRLMRLWIARHASAHALALRFIRSRRRVSAAVLGAQPRACDCITTGKPGEAPSCHNNPSCRSHSPCLVSLHCASAGSLLVDAVTYWARRRCAQLCITTQRAARCAGKRLRIARHASAHSLALRRC